jgi:ABC-type multidrug transport system fused ATPase/permease subunit
MQILLLDEATSALDANSEAIVTQALNALALGGKLKSHSSSSLSTSSSSSSSSSSSPMHGSSLQLRSTLGAASALDLERAAAAACSSPGRTTIIIAHRLATVTAADTIAVLSTGGRLLELGSPSELLNNKGAYAEMVMQQHHGMA